MKRNILIKKTLVFLFALLCSNNSWAYDFKVDGIYYNVSGSEATVTYRDTYNYDSYSGRVVIPETVTYNGTTYTVTSIGDYAFDNSSDLLEVTIPNSVTSIGNHAFNECHRLTQLTIPNSVTTIGDYAFRECI